jgi:hypothetical protein
MLFCVVGAYISSGCGGGSSSGSSSSDSSSSSSSSSRHGGAVSTAQKKQSGSSFYAPVVFPSLVTMSQHPITTNHCVHASSGVSAVGAAFAIVVELSHAAALSLA